METLPVHAVESVDGDTATRILDVAERLAMTRGFSRLSYADIADELGVTKPALHYHFRTKALLGEALVRRYALRFSDELDRIDSVATDARGKLERYVDMYRAVLGTGRMCLCGMLAAEYASLSVGMRSAVNDFFERNEHWLADVLTRGHERDSVQLQAAQVSARTIINALEGAMLLARVFQDVARFDASSQRLIAEVLRISESANALPVEVAAP